MVDKKFDEQVAQFVSVTGISTKEARKFIEKYKRADVAIDAYYNNPTQFGARSPAAVSTSKLNTLFDKYKDREDDEITEGTLKLCEDLSVDPLDVVMLALAFELKSPRVGCWTRQGWTEGWKSIGVDTIEGMRKALPGLKESLGSDPEYFRKVYNHTFTFGREEGQRSLAFESAQAFWELLLPHGLQNGAINTTGWQPESTTMWFDFLKVQKGGKGISKDTWSMFLDFVCSIDAEFKVYDMDGAWPSTIDEFVEYGRKNLK